MNYPCTLILGSNGQDGSLLCQSLLKKNQKVVGTSRFCRKPKTNLKKLNIEKDVEHVQLNLTNQLELEKVIQHYQPNIIYNLSAQSSVGLSFNQPQETFLSISYATQNLLEVCRKIDFKGTIFFAGSSEMYGNSKKRINLEDPKSPSSPYAIAKLNSFNIVKMYRTLFNIKCITGVLFNHESILRNENFVFPKIIKSAVCSSENRNYQTSIGNIKIQRDWGWAEEYVEAMELIANKSLGKDYLICTGKVHTLEDVIDKAFKVFNLDWQEHMIINPNLFRAEDLEISFGNPMDLFEDLEWKPKVCIDQIIEKLIQNYKAENY